MWDVFGKNGVIDTFDHGSEVIQAVFHPNGNDIITTTLSGQIYVWDVQESSIKSMIECKSDI